MNDEIVYRIDYSGLSYAYNYVYGITGKIEHFAKLKKDPTFTLVPNTRYMTSKGVVTIECNGDLCGEYLDGFGIQLWTGVRPNKEVVLFSQNGSCFDPYTGLFYKTDDIIYCL